MASKNGMLLICDLCGATVFLESVGEGERDGGFTRWNKFEKPPEGWGCASYSKKINNLCPNCNKEYQKIIADFENKIKEFESNGIQKKG